MLAVAAAPSRAGLASSARRAALRPCRTAAPTRQRPARHLCCQPTTASLAADKVARAATYFTEGAALAVIGPPLLLCGVAIARRLLPQLADRHFDGPTTASVLVWVTFYCLFVMVGMANDAVTEVAAGGALCLTSPSAWLLGKEAALHLGLLPPAGTASQDEAD